MTTGVDAPTCQNVMLVRVIGSITEFKQIIGRGTRVRDDKGKLFFNILDYTGSATRLFADPDFDGEPDFAETELIDDAGQTIEGSQQIDEQAPPPAEDAEAGKPQYDDEPHEPRKFYVRGGKVEIDTEVTYDLNTDGNKLRTVQISQYVADTVRTLYTDADDLRRKWSDFEQRSAVVELLEERGIDFNELAAAAGQPEADPFDLLCHVAYNAPLRTRRERAERLQTEKKDFFDRFGPDARTIVNELLEKYAEHGAAQFTIPDVFEVPPISRHGNLKEIAEKFGGTEKLVAAFNELQELLYAA